MTIRSSRTRGFTIIAALLAALSAGQVQAQAPAAPAGAATAYSTQELEKLVDRIALYPDDLVAIILPASTNPLQIVQADRFLEKRKADPKAPVDEKWDDAVKSLLNYPEVVKKMSQDLDWTAQLGEAVVTDNGAVLEAIQSFRRKTQAVGNLKSDQKQTVVVEKEVIKIVPADPQVIYVPQYNPTTVVVSGGYSAWGYYPSPYPVYYYPYAPGAAFATGLVWGAAISAAWHGGYYHTNWGGGGNNTINIDRSQNVNIQGGDRTRTTTTSGGGSQWKANKQPGQVSGSVGRQPAGGRVGDGARASTQPSGGRDLGGRDAGGRDAGGGARPSQQPAGGRDFGGRDGGGGGAFDGAGGSGRDARMDSARGASSRSSMSGGGGGGARASGGYSGGGARAGGGFSGGGGARAGGGRGGRR